ncbi:hypothetical protein RhiTH_006651 [Rhizoctonia solani]
MPSVNRPVEEHKAGTQDTSTTHGPGKSTLKIVITENREEMWEEKTRRALLDPFVNRA